MSIHISCCSSTFVATTSILSQLNKFLCVAALVIALTSCKKEAASNKVRVGYIGLTCEAPIFTAVEKGFFKEEGLEVSLVKCEWANYKDVLALGGFDITHHLVMYFLKPIEQGELGLALDKGEVDAVADSEPIGSLLLAQGKVKNVADQAKDAPYKDEYCCAVIVSGKFLAANPKAAAAATRALLKAAKWVEANPAAAARLSVEKKYLASNPELNTVAISHLRYVPSVSGADEAVKSAAAEMKTAGMLSPSTNVAELAKRAFAHLDGVSDEWLNQLEVERLAGGQVPPDQDIRLFAELILSDTEESCCKARKSLAKAK